MTWHTWFPDEKPGRVGLARIYREAARQALDEARCEVGWLPSGAVVQTPDGPVSGFTQGDPRRVYVPIPDTIGDLATVLHECGHLATARGGATDLELEASANEWALRRWKDWGLPDIEQAEFALQRGYEAAVRHEQALDNTPLRQIEKALAA